MAARCTFLSTHCLIQKQTDDHILGMGKIVGKLYIVRSLVSSRVNAVSTMDDYTAEEWHRLLGHISVTTMNMYPVCEIYVPQRLVFTSCI